MNKDTKPWVIFDADNTLWDVEVLYNLARTRFAKHLAEFVLKKPDKYPYCDAAQGVDCVTKQLELDQDKVDKSLYDVFGYSASRYPRSFEETTITALNRATIHHLNDEEIILLRELREIAERVFLERAPLYPGARESVGKTRAKGYHCAILTEGEKWVQDRRLAQSSLIPHVDVVAVIDSKSTDQLLQFCTDNYIVPGDTWMIGDSLRSDIRPAKEVGMKTIHIPNRNWNGHAVDIEPDYQAKTIEAAVNFLPDI